MDSDPVSISHPVSVRVDAPVADASPVASGRRMLAALCLGAFAATLVTIAPAPFFPDMADDLEVGVPLLGQVLTLMLLLSGILGLAIGPLADRYGYRRLIVLGLGAAALCLTTIGVAPTFPVLLGGSVAGGLADAAVLGPVLVVAGTAFTGAASRRALGWTTASMAGSGVVGVPLLAAGGDVVGWRAAFVASGAVVAVIACLAAAWLPPDGLRPDDRLRIGTLLAAYRPLIGHGPTLRLYGCSMLRAVCWYGLLAYLGAFLGGELGMSTRAVGGAYLLAGSGYVLGSLLAGGPLSRVPARVLLAGGNGALALLIGLAFSEVFGMVGTVAALLLAAFAAALGWVGIASLLIAESPAGPGTTMALHGSLFNLGAAAGGAAGGLLLALGGYGALALGLPIFGIVSALLVQPPRAIGMFARLHPRD